MCRQSFKLAFDYSFKTSVSDFMLKKRYCFFIDVDLAHVIFIKKFQIRQLAVNLNLSCYCYSSTQEKVESKLLQIVSYCAMKGKPKWNRSEKAEVRPFVCEFVESFIGALYD